MKNFLRIIDGSKKELSELKLMNEDLSRRVEELKDECSRVSKENDSLKLLNQELMQKIEEMENEVLEDDDSLQDELSKNAAGFLETIGIDTLELEVRTYKGLCRRGLTTVAEIISHPMSDIVERTRNFGWHAANDLAEQLMRTWGVEVAREEDQRKQKMVDRKLLPSRMALMSIDDMELSVKAYYAISRWNDGRDRWASRIDSAYDLYWCYKRNKLSEIMDEKQAKEVIVKMKELGFLN